MRTLVVGAAIVDLMMKVERLPKSGEDIPCKETKMVVGGCAYNVANTLRNLKCEHDLCVPVGSGSFADIIRRGMKEKGYEPMITAIESETMENLFALKPILHINEAEAKGYTQQENVEEAVRALYEKSGNLVFVTLGAEGTLFYDGKEMRRVASVKTNVVDTVGAGDSHIGAIIAGMSKGMKVEDAVLLANRTAAAIVGTSGPVMDLEEFQKISEEWENE